MLELFAAMALALSAPQSAPSGALVKCLANYSHAPEYASQTNEQIAQNEAFFEAATGRYCSSEASPLWDVAHDRARRTLGVQPGSGNSLEQQEIAEREFRALIGEAWAKAIEHRATARLTNKMLEEIMGDWLTSEMLDEVEAPVLCAQKAMQQGGGPSTFGIIAGISGMQVRVSKAIGERCGYPGVQAALTQALHRRFPDARATSVERVARSFLNEMTFWGSLTQ